MARERANLKVPPDLLERFNDARNGMVQAAFLRELLDDYEETDEELTTEQVREIVRDELRAFEETTDTDDCLGADEAREVMRDELQEVKEMIDNAR